jgi:hypothetical protein
MEIPKDVKARLGLPILGHRRPPVGNEGGNRARFLHCSKTVQARSGSYVWDWTHLAFSIPCNLNCGAP